MRTDARANKFDRANKGCIADYLMQLRPSVRVAQFIVFHAIQADGSSPNAVLRDIYAARFRLDGLERHSVPSILLIGSGQLEAVPQERETT
jgi:hypothetical protein